MPGPRPGLRSIKKGTIKRLFSILFKNYKGMLCIILAGIIISAVASSVAGLFLNKVYATLEYYLTEKLSYDEAWSRISLALLMLGIIYLISIVSSAVFNFVGATLTQRFLRGGLRSTRDNNTETPCRRAYTCCYKSLCGSYRICGCRQGREYCRNYRTA